MLDFEFYNPTRIVFGRNTIPRLATLVPQAARVLVLYGGESARKDAGINAAIARTEDFFHGLGIRTRLADYGLDAAAIDPLVAQLEAHGMTAISEHGDITPAVSRRILEAAL